MTTASVIAFHLFRGDELLGTLVRSPASAHSVWQGGTFEPTAEFERVRPLFGGLEAWIAAGHPAEAISTGTATVVLSTAGP